MFLSSFSCYPQSQTHQAIQVQHSSRSECRSVSVHGWDKILKWTSLGFTWCKPTWSHWSSSKDWLEGLVPPPLVLTCKGSLIPSANLSLYFVTICQWYHHEFYEFIPSGSMLDLIEPKCCYHTGLKGISTNGKQMDCKLRISVNLLYPREYCKVIFTLRVILISKVSYRDPPKIPFRTSTNYAFSRLFNLARLFWPCQGKRLKDGLERSSS